MIVVPEPASGIILDFFGAVEQILCQPIVTDRSVVAFDIGVLLRLARLDKRQLDLKPFTLSGAGLGDKADESAILLDIQTVWRFFYGFDIWPAATSPHPSSSGWHSGQWVPQSDM